MPLIKYRENSRWYHQYGRYALADQRNHIVCPSSWTSPGVLIAIAQTGHAANRPNLGPPP
jgi:hypothetical protein